MVQLTKTRVGDVIEVKFAWDGLSYTLIDVATPRQRRNGTMQLKFRGSKREFVLTKTANCTTNVRISPISYFRDMSGRTPRVITGNRDIEIVQASAFLHFAQIVENKKILQINQKLEMVAKTNSWSKFIFNEVGIFDIPRFYGKLVKVLPPYEIVHNTENVDVDQRDMYEIFNNNQPTLFGVLVDPHFLEDLVSEDSLLAVEWQSRIRPTATWAATPEKAVELFEMGVENCVSLVLSKNPKVIVEKTSRIIPLSD